MALCRPDGLRETAAPHLTDLFVATSGKAAVHLAVLEDTDVVYLEKIAGPSTMRVPTRVGGRMNAACSGLGKAILAFSDRAAIGAVLDQGLERRTRYSAADPVRFLQQLRRVRAEGGLRPRGGHARTGLRRGAHPGRRPPGRRDLPVRARDRVQPDRRRSVAPANGRRDLAGPRRLTTRSPAKRPPDHDDRGRSRAAGLSCRR